MTKHRFLRRFAATAVVGVSPFVLASAVAQAQSEVPLFTPASDAAAGQVHFTIPQPNAEGSAGCYIYASSIRGGLGSPVNQIDRGMLGDSHLLCFRLIGGKIAAVFENPKFRATGDAATEAGARESFAYSVAAMLPVLNDGGRDGLTVDITPFLQRDAVNIADRLGGSGGGEYRHSAELSGVDTASLKAFPRNVEVDVVQTFTAPRAGSEIRDIAVEPRNLSFTVHHSFVALPEEGFVTRQFDTRAPAFGPMVYDYGAPLGEPVAVHLAARFRLERTDPSAERSTVKNPIVFYIDNAAPEPVRTALMEGVNYWQPSFERAGFIDAFRAEILPEGADPLDVRYNMVNWANRMTRGWSYGGGIIDPRTGEIIKGNVVLGALRVRQDISIFEALVGTAENNTGRPNDPVKAALDRIRQLGAHEVGHALGFMHNFAGSTQGRTTVMDYPPPRIGITDGRIDISDAYEPGGGAWDDFSIDWLYADPAPGIDPDAHAREKALAAKEAGLAFVTDIDGRDPADPSPVASMWDDGPDPVAALQNMLAVRSAALANFGEQVLLPNESLSNLRRKFVPVWLLHRYDVDAAGKVIGGLEMEYKVRGDNQGLPEAFSGASQRAALDAMIGTLSSDLLTVSDRLVPLLSVPITGLDDPQFNREVFQNAGSSVFDPLVAADVAAQITLDSLLAPTRLRRLLDQHRRDPSLPGAEEVVDAIVNRVVAERGDPVARRIAWRAIMTMAAMRQHDATSPGAAAILDSRLSALQADLARASGNSEAAVWSRYVASVLSDRALLTGMIGNREEAPAIPPGMPIGGAGGWHDK